MIREWIDFMPAFIEQAKEDPRFKVTDDGWITVNTDHYEWKENGGVHLDGPMEYP